MKNKIKIPRILKINSIDGFNIFCIFNNGETRVIDFKDLFQKWKIKKNDPEYILTKQTEFKKVSLRNQTLSWKNVKIKLVTLEGKETFHAYELSPDILYLNSKPIQKAEHRYYFGDTIRDIRNKEGMTQEELAKLSGTSKTYISRVENNLIEPEFTTLYKIIELGLGKKIRIEIR